jgi:beta-lactam-binding protein with PASTA domain
MAKTFTITTTATDALKTDAKGHAEAVFTVTNTSSRPVRGMARARALESTKQEWLRLSGETERDFAPGGTQQFVVTFDAPGAAPAPAAAGPGTAPPSAEQYSFRLDVSSATNPDEDFTEGPVVQVQLPKAAPPPTPSKFPKWLIPVIAVVALAVIGLIVWLVIPKGPKKYTLPDVATLSAADAQQALETGCSEGTGCVVVKVTPISDNTTPKDSAVGTEPAANTEVAVGSEVSLLISSGPAVETYKIPPVKDVPQDKAKTTLEGNCKTVTPCVIVEVSNTSDNQIASGNAIRTEPKEGTDVNAGSKVTLFVSSGPNKFPLPPVTGEIADAARQKLQTACGATNCVEVEGNVIASNTIQAGHAINTLPPAGTTVTVGSKVKLFVSGGSDQVVIPPVFNRTVAEAKNLLANACQPTPCLNATQVNQNHDTVAAGRAISTTPPFGMVKIGSTIVLNVSTGPQMFPVGHYTGLTEAQAKQKIVQDGFKVGTIQRQPFFFIHPAKVVNQNPAPPATRPKGTLINLNVIGTN